MFLPDTNVLSELRRPDRADPNVASWADGADPAEFYLSATTILEIEIGTLLIQRRDEAQGIMLRNWINNQVLPGLNGRIFPVDIAVAQRCAQLHVPDPRAERDALIAATALVHHLTVVTRNTADFQSMGVDLLNPREA
jgi:hypothetical protein